MLPEEEERVDRLHRFLARDVVERSGAERDAETGVIDEDGSPADLLVEPVDYARDDVRGGNRAPASR